MTATHPLTGWFRELVRWKRSQPSELPTHAIDLTELRDELSSSIKKWRELFGTFHKWVTSTQLAHAAEQAADSDTTPLVLQLQALAAAYKEMIDSEGRPHAQPHLRPGIVDFLQGDSRHRYVKLINQCIQGFLSITKLAKDYQFTHHWENGGKDAFLAFHNSLMSLAEAIVNHRKGLIPAPPAMSDETARMVEKYVTIIESRETTEAGDDDDDDDDEPTSAELYTEMLEEAALVSRACQTLLILFEGLRRQVQDRLEFRQQSNPIRPSSQSSSNVKSLYISYAWGNEGENIVDRVYDSLKTSGYDVRRDKQDLAYKGSLTEFMKEMGRGACIIVVVSDKSLRSPYCMFELLEIYRNHHFRERVFPILISDAKIHSTEDRLEYVAHWNAEYERLEKLIKKTGIDLLSADGSFREYEKLRDISQNTDKLLTMLGDMNSSTPTRIEANDFALLKESITARLNAML